MIAQPELVVHGGDLRVAVLPFDDGELAGVRHRLLTCDIDVALLWLVPDLAGAGQRDLPKVGAALSAAEHARLGRIQHPRARAEFLAGRLVIRHALARLCGTTPAAVDLHESERGALSIPDSPWHFNLSHSDGLVVLAVALRPVGVDVEYLARVGRTVELANRYFSSLEVAALQALPEASRRDRFFALWTLKEAYIKARGLGLAVPLASFSFDFEPAPALTPAPDDPHRYRLFLADLGTEHRLAVVRVA